MADRPQTRDVMDLARRGTTQLPPDQPIGFRLEWQPRGRQEMAADLDLGCLYWIDQETRFTRSVTSSAPITLISTTDSA